LADTPIACPVIAPTSGYLCTATPNAAKERAAENGCDGDLVRSVVGVYRPDERDLIRLFGCPFWIANNMSK